MKTKSKRVVHRIANKLGFQIDRAAGPDRAFHSPEYLRHNARRLEHLASLRIPVAGMSVLEVGAGIGDHSHYYIDRGCSITITEVRSNNLQHLKKRYPHNSVRFLDMENPTIVDDSPFDVVHCYGLLYHVRNAEQALEFLSRCTKGFLLLETCVSFGENEALNSIKEDQANPSQASSGIGCRPTRPWLFKRLKRLFENVYLPKTQPNHEQFPLDWAAPEKHQATLQRAIFIASREKLENDMLTTSLVRDQVRHE
jgi:ubiquinone/menaquinone biosynthesis C-methylase UbiE